VADWYIEDGYLKRRSIVEWIEYEVQLLQAAGIKPVRRGDALTIVSEACGRPVKLLVRIGRRYPYEPPEAFYSFDGEFFKHLCYMRREHWVPFHHTIAFVFMQSLAILRQMGKQA
jgi:hypothetical protein